MSIKKLTFLYFTKITVIPMKILLAREEVFGNLLR